VEFAVASGGDGLKHEQLWTSAQEGELDPILVFF
jgi:hypothetical protein